jgi:REP element-mobilizing transposase RayT
MGHRSRTDAPGAHHHVITRAVNQRPLFETRADIRFFLSLMAREVRKGRIRILAYAILTTHCHFVLQSCAGEFSDVMRHVLSRYARRFNRIRSRTGHLVERRFLSFRLKTKRHRINSIQYVDWNAVTAGLVRAPPEYPYCGAFHHAGGRLPKWLDTTWIDALLDHPGPADRPKRYARLFGRPLTKEQLEVLETRQRAAADSEDDLWDDLVGAAPEYVREWMLRKTEVADGSRPGLAYVAPSRVMAEVDSRRANARLLCRSTGTKRTNAWPVLCTGLLRTLAGLTVAECAQRLGVSSSTASVRYRLHVQAMSEEPAYEAVCVEVAVACLQSE